MAANLISLQEVIDGVELMDNEAQYGHHLNKTKKRFLALKALREMNLDVARSVKGKKLPLKPDLTIDLPDDYLDYVGLFILDQRDNSLRPLSRNPYINISNEAILDNNGDPILDNNGEMIYSSRDRTKRGQGSRVISVDNYRRPYPTQNYNGYFGLPTDNNSNGYYRFDYEDNTIQFDIGDDIDYIFIEYISNGLEGILPERVMIPVQVVDAMEAYIMWKSAIYQRGVAAVEKQQLSRNFYNEKRKARTRMSKLISQEMRDSARLYNQLTVNF